MSEFRTSFHIPTKWEDNTSFAALSSFKYRTLDAENALDFIKQSLKDLGYASSDNSTMVHDYIHYFLCDLLKELDLKANRAPHLSQLLNNFTPDLIVSASKKKGKPLLIDVHVGGSDLSSIKGKYKHFGVIFDVSFVSPYNITFNPALRLLIPQDRLDYLYQNLQIFTSEHQYWMSCLKMQRILKNEIQNVRPLVIVPNQQAADLSTTKLITYLEQVAEAIQVFCHFRVELTTDF